ncbi:hypothetical protein ACFQ64_16340 [Streptomyces sp. NPDC056460]
MTAFYQCVPVTFHTGAILTRGMGGECVTTVTPNKDQQVKVLSRD